MAPRLFRRFFALLASAALLLGWSAAARSVSYFVDSDAGNDSWSGTAAFPNGDRSDGPWRNLHRIGLTKLLPGDVVHVKCGDVWREPLKLRQSGTAKQPLLVQSYPAVCDAQRPQINAAAAVTGWRSAGGAVYAAPVEPEVTDVYVDGNYLPPARYPRTGYLIASASDGGKPESRDTISTNVHDALRDMDLIRATVRVRTVDWKIEERTATGVDRAGVLALNKPTEFPIHPGAGFYFTGKSWMLTSPGTWAYDARARELRVWLADGSSPDSHAIEVSRSDNGIIVSHAQHIRISGLSVKHARLDGVAIGNAGHIDLDDMEVADSGRDGIMIENSHDIRVGDSLLRRSHRDAITAVDAKDIVVEGNRIEQSGTVGPPVNSLAAVDMSRGRAVLVRNNRINRSGYHGVRFKRDARILDNIIEDSCIVLDDCGAIYVWADNDPTPPLNSEVIGNIVDRAPGNTDGKPDPATLTAGIYLDDLSNGVRVAGNTVSHADIGVYIHNGFNLTVEANTLSNNRRAQLLIGMNHPRMRGDALVGNKVTGNSLRYDTTALGVEIITNSPAVRHADFDNNHYITDGGQAIALETPPPDKVGGEPPRLFTLERWRTMRGQETHGSVTVSGRQQTDQNPGDSLMQSSFSRGTEGWNQWSPDRRGGIKWQAKCPNLASGCLELDPGSTFVLATSPTIALAAGQPCALAISVRSDSPDNPLQVRMRRNTPPFPSVGLENHVLATSAWSDYAIPFTVNALASESAQVELKATAGRAIQVAEVRLHCRKPANK